jgi:PAS domain S-box-containing protein
MESRRRVPADCDAAPLGPAAVAAGPFPQTAEAPPQAEHLLAQLREVHEERDRLQRALSLRNCALDASTTHFMITDVTARGWPIVYVNRALARDHGYAPEELLGLSAMQLVPAELNPIQLDAVNHELRNGNCVRSELRSRRKDGSTFWAGIAVHPIRDAQGHVTHYVSVGADITARLRDAEEKRRLQDQLFSEMQERERIAIELRFAQKLEAVGRLAAGIAHEINTPVQYIGDGVTFLQSSLAELQSLLETYRSVSTRLIAEHPSADALREIENAEANVDWPFLSVETPKAITRTLDGIARVAAIVRAMKEFAHPDSSERSGADLNHAIETTLTVARSEYKYVARVETLFGAIPQILCNVGELNQVFLNLIVNAAHAIEASGKDAEFGRICISTACSGPSVEVIVADNGCGIPEQNLERIFDPFFTTKEVGKGTGQGLAIARSIVVDRHGGTIDVLSVPNEGTRFRLRLPVTGRPGTPP